MVRNSRRRDGRYVRAEVVGPSSLRGGRRRGGRVFFFSSRRRHTRYWPDWSSDVCSSDLLPLSHSYEHTVGCFLLPSLGMEVVYSRGAERLAAEMAEVRPTILTAVPRLFEVLRARMLAQVEKESGLKRRLFERALRLGLRRLDGPPLNLLERAQDAALDRLVRSKVRARFGGR